MEEICPYCGENKAKQHQQFCIKNHNRRHPKAHKLLSSEAKPDATAGDNTTRTVEKTVIPAPAVSNKKSLSNAIKHVFPKSEPKTEEELLFTNKDDFFNRLPKWTAKKPSLFKRLLLKRGLEYKNVVFVDKKGNGQISYLPYDLDKHRIIIEKHGYYEIDIEGDTIYLSKEKLLPLANVPDLSRFQNSANYVLSVYNGGLKEGLILRFDELMEEINKERIFKLLCLGIAVLCLIALGLTVYSDGNTIKGLIANNAEQAKLLANYSKVH